MGDHERSDIHEASASTSASRSTGWGGDDTYLYSADPSTVVAVPALLLARGDK